jgi:hypothetical protein
LLTKKKKSYEQKIISAEKIVEEEKVLKEITNRERKKLKLS